LLDRDGTIIVERNYLSDPENVELLPYAASGLRALRSLGFGLVVVTNQSGIGRGYFTAETVDSIHSKLEEALSAEGVSLDGIYVCPHTPEEMCKCRKPAPGLALRAAADWGFRLNEAVVIGDKPCDMELGREIGARSVLVKTGYGALYSQSKSVDPDSVVSNLEEAARLLAEAGR
jgi:D-glycero-D-manno-heptose 1,7-bisphosphate phosphatase